MEFAVLAKLLDLFVALVRERGASHKELFSEYVDPLYRDAQVVYTDLRETLQAAKDALEKADTVLAVTIIEQRRSKYKAAREHLRSVVAEWTKRHGELPRFEKGILGVLMGGASQFISAGEARLLFSDCPVQWRGRHTLLDVLERLQLDPLINLDRFTPPDLAEDSKVFRAKMNVMMQLRAIDLSWAEVTQGYVELRAQHGRLPKHD